jgi:hypothetical protein
VLEEMFNNPGSLLATHVTDFQLLQIFECVIKKH